MKAKLLFTFLFISQAFNSYSQEFCVSTHAGNGTIGYVDGVSYNAQFNRPSSLCFDGSGNMYVADWGTHTIRKITPGGIVSTLAGNGTAGFNNATGTSATFDRPSFIDIDLNTGDLYVADIGNECIRKVTQTGVVTTYAGTGTAGYQDGPAASAQFNALAGIALDASGNLYVCDRNNFRIRKISSTGTVSTVAGNGSSGNTNGAALSSSFAYPADVDVNSTGLLFIADRNNDVIRVFDPVNNTVSTYAGNGSTSSTDGSLTTGSFDAPRGIFITELDDIYVADQDGNKIRLISGNSISTIAGTGNAGFQDGPGDYAQFNLPWDVSYFQGVIYVAGDMDNRIRKIVKKFSPNAIEENEYQISLNIFPNPATDFINLEIQSVENFDGIEIDIYTINGQLVLSDYIGDFISGQIINFPLSDDRFTTGQYILLLRNREKNILTEKFIIE